MTKRATFTQAELTRATKVAGKEGLRVMVTGGAIYLVTTEDVPITSTPEDSGDEALCDEAFGVSS